MAHTKGSVKAETFLSRVGSHSTKPTRKGDMTGLAQRNYDIEYSIEAISEERKEEERLSIRRVFLEKSLLELKEKLLPIKERLVKTLPHKKFISLSSKKVKLGCEIQKIQNELQSNKIKMQGVNSQLSSDFNNFFKEVARKILPNDVFMQIIHQSKKEWKILEKDRVGLCLKD